MENLQSMIGVKLFKELDDSVEILRIVHVRKYANPKDNPSEITVRNEGTGENKKVRVDSLKEYHPLEPDGLITFNIVGVKDAKGEMSKDIVVTGSKILNVKIGDTMPYCICRQSITDIFYNLLCKSENDMMAGLAVNQDDCPANFDFRITLACSEISYTESINFYRTDTLEDILTMVNENKFDEVLADLYKKHVYSVGNPSLLFKTSHKGWCKNLRTLLKENNFQNDLDEMLGITELGFDVSKHLIEKPIPGKEEYMYQIPSDELVGWLSSVFKLNITTARIIEFGPDINLAEFNNSTYLLLRDSENKLWLMVYTSNGEYLESDLEEENNKKDFSDEFRLAFFNKYQESKSNI